jgi:hypothetical protein
MAYLYVKSGGTATGTAGRYTSPKTGSWSAAFSAVSEYYGNIALAITNSSTLDTILVSNLHNYIYGSAGSYSILSSAKSLYIISVDNSDVTTELFGAKESDPYALSPGNYYILLSVNYAYGLEISAPYLIYLNGTTINYAKLAVFENCKFSLISSNTAQPILHICSGVKFVNCIFDFGASNATYLTYIQMAYSGNPGYQNLEIFENCTFISYESTTQALIRGRTETNIYHVFELKFDACDFSQCNRPLIDALRSNNEIYAGDSRYYYRTNNSYRVSRCIESPNLRLMFPTNGPSSKVSGWFYSGSDNKSVLRIYGLGTITNNYSIYRTYGAKFNLTDYYSFNVSTFTNFKKPYFPSSPFYFKLCDMRMDISANRTFTVEFAQNNNAVPLVESDIGLEIYYTDDITSKSHRDSSTIHAIPSTIPVPASKKSWIGLTNPTRQYLSVTTSDTGSYGLCSVYLKIFKAGVDLYICPKVDIS